MSTNGSSNTLSANSHERARPAFLREEERGSSAIQTGFVAQKQSFTRTPSDVTIPSGRGASGSSAIHCV